MRQRQEGRDQIAHGFEQPPPDAGTCRSPRSVQGGGRATASTQTAEPQTPKARPCEMTAPSAGPGQQRSEQGQSLREMLALRPHEGQCQPPLFLLGTDRTICSPFPWFPREKSRMAYYFPARFA